MSRLPVEKMPKNIYAYHQVRGTGTWIYFDNGTKDDPSCKYIRADLAPQWRPENEAPKGVPVIVRGGLAMKKTGGEWFSGMEEPLYQRSLQWKPDCWMPLPEPPE